jgi:hypothetical protein
MSMSVNPQPTLARGEWSQLVKLFAEASPLRMGHWNPQTGEIFAAPRRKNSRAIAVAFELRVLQEDGWLEVPFLESDEAFSLAVNWAQSLDPGRGKAAVTHALAQDKPFRQLRVVLGQMVGLQRRYEKAVREEAEARLVELCVGLGLTLDHPRFVELAPYFQDQEEVGSSPIVSAVQRRVDALSIGRPPCA